MSHQRGNRSDHARNKAIILEALRLRTEGGAFVPSSVIIADVLSTGALKCSEVTIRKHLRELSESGEITRRPKRRSSHYRYRWRRKAIVSQMTHVYDDGETIFLGERVPLTEAEERHLFMMETDPAYEAAQLRGMAIFLRHETADLLEEMLDARWVIWEGPEAFVRKIQGIHDTLDRMTRSTIDGADWSQTQEREQTQ